MEIFWRILRVFALVASGSNLTRLYYETGHFEFNGNYVFHIIITAIIVVGAINDAFSHS
jgi:hypothetical protein